MVTIMIITYGDIQNLIFRLEVCKYYGTFPFSVVAAVLGIVTLVLV